MAIDPVTGAIIGASVVSNYLGNQSANNAQNLSQSQFNQTQANLAPYQQSGINALNEVNSQLGLTQGFTPLTFDQWGAQNPGTPGYYESIIPNGPTGNIPDPSGGHGQITANYFGNTGGNFVPGTGPSREGYEEYLANNPATAAPAATGYQGAPPAYNVNYNPAEYGGLPEYSGAPEYTSTGGFDFNLEADPGFNFARDEAIKATNRAQNSQGGFNSGNRLTAIGDRVTGVASQFANDAFNRQLGQSRENYGRGVTDYGINRENVLNDYNINRGNALTDFGIRQNQAQTQYDVDNNAFNIQRQLEADIYGRDQTRLNQLFNLAGAGQNAAVAQGGFGAQNTSNQIQAGQFGVNSLNNSIQSGLGNYLLSDYLNNNNQPSGPYSGGFDSSTYLGY